MAGMGADQLILCHLQDSDSPDKRCSDLCDERHLFAGSQIAPSDAPPAVIEFSINSVLDLNSQPLNDSIWSPLAEPELPIHTPPPK